MSRGIRLPTLHPMPRDIDQYWTCYQACLPEPAAREYEEKLAASLTRTDGRAYSRSTIRRLISNLTGKGFVRVRGGGVLPPDGVPRLWDGRWDEKEDGFPTYIGMTMLKWGRLFPDGLALAHDLLTELAIRPDNDSPSSLWRALSDPRSGSGRYDGGDSYGRRTVGETLRLLEFAGWIDRAGGKARITKVGRNRRQDLRDRDVFHRIRWLFGRVNPVATGVLDAAEKIALTKAVMYRESGGKGKRSPIQAAHDALFRHPYGRALRPKIERQIDTGRQALEELRDEIRALSASVGRRVRRIRSEEKLERIRDALREGREERALLILDSSGAGLSRRTLGKLKHAGPDFSLADRITPHEWQSRALAEWLGRGTRGILEVVTGAGKTVFALMAIARLIEDEADLRVSVVVPTKVLMYQWTTELVRLLGVPPTLIGLRGDGHRESFRDGKRTVVNVINSAVLGDQLRKDIDRLPRLTPHLLIADECHRYRGREFRRVFDCRFDHSLGLSATPGDPTTGVGRGRDGVDHGDDPVSRLGSRFYGYSYQEALSDRVIQPFTVCYVGVELTTDERQAYETDTKRIRRALRTIRRRYGPRLDAMRGPFYARLHSIINSDESPDPAIHRYFEAVRERKALVYAARNRKGAYLDIISKHTVEKGERQDRVIVFHERIGDLEQVVAPMDRRGSGKTTEVDRLLEDLFFKSAFRPVMYHSGQSSGIWNETSMDFFRSGLANVMLSVRALVEGVDVPAANVGIIRASSSSVRQRIQTTGRILRRAGGKDGAARLYVIYVRDTTDERIFSEVNWSEELGSSAVRSVHWYPPTGRREVTGVWDDQEGALPDVSAEWVDEQLPEFDVGDLKPGDLYPGMYAGEEYHVDAGGRPFRNTRRGRQFMTNAEVRSAAELIFRLKRGGKFVVSPDNHMVTRVNGDLVFLGVLDGKPEFETHSASQYGLPDAEPPTFEALFG